MTEVQWTDAEREAVAATLGCKPSAHDSACLTHNMPGNWGNRGHWMDEPDAILDALAPHVAAREAQAAAKAEGRVKQAIRECHDDPAKAVFDADRLAGEAIVRAHAAEAALAEIAATGCCACHGPAEAERDRLAETLRLRSEALDRVVAENTRLQATVKAALLAAWDDGNALGLDGWIGPERGEEPDDHAIRRREEYVRKALDRLAGGSDGQ